ncbi:MAG: ABC transporter substrate-binding protein, partial [Rivularia sp. ALOHA_DT_140]|nr:ABC transporter substrate-binding protein [Rivularia sp. ALOHA_DT_140]
SKYTYLYRIAPNDNASAQKIAKYLNNKTTPQTIAIFWSKGKTFSDSLRDASIKELGGTIINNNIVDEEIFDLSTQNFNADRVLNEIKRQGVTAIILIPDSSGDDSPAIRNAHELIQKNQEPNLIIIGGDTLYTNNTRQVVQESVAKDNFFTAVAWHPLANPQFTQNAQRWWGTRNISWLTGTSYDATLVLNQATRNSNNREGVNQILSDEQFILREGATGSIKFEGSDRAEQESTLVKTLNFCDNRLNYVFVPEDYPGSCVSPDR